MACNMPLSPALWVGRMGGGCMYLYVVYLCLTQMFILAPMQGSMEPEIGSMINSYQSCKSVMINSDQL